MVREVDALVYVVYENSFIPVKHLYDFFGALFVDRLLIK